MPSPSITADPIESDWEGITPVVVTQEAGGDRKRSSRWLSSDALGMLLLVGGVIPATELSLGVMDGRVVELSLDV
jgi:glycerol-3-phosphate dehydrogenase